MFSHMTYQFFHISPSFSLKLQRKVKNYTAYICTPCLPTSQFPRLYAFVLPPNSWVLEFITFSCRHLSFYLFHIDISVFPSNIRATHLYFILVRLMLNKTKCIFLPIKHVESVILLRDETIFLCLFSILSVYWSRMPSLLEDI